MDTQIFDVDFLISDAVLSDNQYYLLKTALRSGSNIIFVGERKSGLTTLFRSFLYSLHNSFIANCNIFEMVDENSIHNILDSLHNQLMFSISKDTFNSVDLKNLLQGYSAALSSDRHKLFYFVHVSKCEKDCKTLPFKITSIETLYLV